MNLFRTLRPITHPTLIAVVTLLTGCQQEEISLPAFDGNRAYEEVAKLVKIAPRDAGTPGALQAAQHIESRLNSFGLEAQLHTFDDQTPAGKKTFHNVIGRIPGRSDRWIIFGSHFDTMPGIANFQGANDSGSSTGVLLELANTLKGSAPEVGIIFAFFDGEEGIADYIPGDGLHGSSRYAYDLMKTGEANQVDAMILLDMVGDADLNYTVPLNSSRPLVQQLFKAAEATGNRRYLSLSQTSIIDDHVPFLMANIPAIDLIDFRFGSAPGLNDYWHTELDDMEHISADSLQITGDIVLQLLKQLQAQ